MQAPAPPEGHQNRLASLYTQNAGPRPVKKTFRNIPQAPERILDAPDLLDDYYLNLLDWSSNNVVSPPLLPSSIMGPSAMSHLCQHRGAHIMIRKNQSCS